jgi:hypothetical protein
MSPRRSGPLAVASCLLLASLSLHAQQSGDNRELIALRAARLLDTKGESALQNGGVLIAGEKITAVGCALSIPPNAKVIARTPRREEGTGTSSHETRKRSVLDGSLG